MEMQNHVKDKRIKNSGNNLNHSARREAISENRRVGGRKMTKERTRIKDKTKSWKCVETAPENAEKYQYKACGLDGVYLLNGFDTVTTSEGVGVTVRNIDALHDAIGQHLVTERKELSGKELRFLRKEMDLTQAELGRFIGLSSQQVARWEKAESAISQPADYLLRKLYLEHINGEVSLKELVEELDDKDSSEPREQLFSAADGKWRPVAA
jgi:DNA-binding transcriptional regulator YiaG